jgi:hypothetical protein
MARAEGYTIVHADRQFIVPTDGKPIRGLIQDHVIAGVEITCRWVGLLCGAACFSKKRSVCGTGVCICVIVALGGRRQGKHAHGRCRSLSKWLNARPVNCLH